MDSLGSLLGRQKFIEPPEVELIKSYVQNKYKSAVNVLVTDKQITIIAASAALAGTLRMELHNLKQQLKTDKKLTVRIG